MSDGKILMDSGLLAFFWANASNSAGDGYREIMEAGSPEKEADRNKRLVR